MPPTWKIGRAFLGIQNLKPGFHMVVSDGDVSQQRIGDAAGTLKTIWKRVYSDVPDVPIMSPTSP